MLYEMICEFYALYEMPFAIHETQINMINILHFLETDGFVLSTEIEDSFVLARPAGHLALSREEHIFCCRK